MQWLLIGAVVWLLSRSQTTSPTSDSNGSKGTQDETTTTTTTTTTKTPIAVLPHTATDAPHDLALQKPQSGLDPVSGKYVFG
jgi:hypothetical protein